MPNMLAELCAVPFAGVVERRFVVGKSCFKRGLGEPNISLGWPACPPLSLLLGRQRMILGNSRP